MLRFVQLVHSKAQSTCLQIFISSYHDAGIAVASCQSHPFHTTEIAGSLRVHKRIETFVNCIVVQSSHRIAATIGIRLRWTVPVPGDVLIANRKRHCGTDLHNGTKPCSPGIQSQADRHYTRAVDGIDNRFFCALSTVQNQICSDDHTAVASLRDLNPVFLYRNIFIGFLPIAIDIADIVAISCAPEVRDGSLFNKKIILIVIILHGACRFIDLKVEICSRYGDYLWIAFLIDHHFLVGNHRRYCRCICRNGKLLMCNLMPCFRPEGIFLQANPDIQIIFRTSLFLCG